MSVEKGSAAAAGSQRVHGAAFNQLSKWRQTQNPLRGLSQPVVTNLIEQAERGAQADFQWLLRWIAKEDAVMHALEKRFLGAVSDLDWSIKVADHTPERYKALAEEQKLKLEDFYHNLRGLSLTLEALALAYFRGCAFLEKAIIKKKRCLDPVPQWYFVRDGLGPWHYNGTAASGATSGTPLETERWVIREVDSPIGRIAARLFVIKGMSIVDLQSYIRVYGIPALLLLMPEGIDPTQAGEFQAIAEKIASEASGCLPAGSDVKTVTGGGTGTSPHLELADWCDKQLVLAGTGGLLTMLAESGSGTLAGGAHMEAFKLLARAEAKKISECLQDQIDAGLLEHWFPGEPQFAYFSLDANEENDPNTVVDHYNKLATGPRPLFIKREEMAEKTGYEFEEDAAAPASETPASETPASAPAGPMLLENEAPETMPEEPAAAGALQGLRSKVDAARKNDFAEVVDGLLALRDLEPGSAEFKAGLEALRPVLEALDGAEPGTLDLDRAFEEIAADGLLEGWAGTPEA